MNDQEFRPDNGAAPEERTEETVSPAKEAPAAEAAHEVPAEAASAPEERDEHPPVQPTAWRSDTPTWNPPPAQRPAAPPPTGWQQQQQRPQQNAYTWSAPSQPTPPAPVPPRRPRNSSGIWIALLGAVCAVCIFLSAGMLVLSVLDPLDMLKNNLSDGTTPPVTTPTRVDGGNNTNTPNIITVEPEEEGLPSSEIVAANLDSTVIIRMYTNVGTGFFSQTVEETEAGEATGIVWTADGYIITNAHCVYDEDHSRLFSRIEVELYDGTVFPEATVVGYDTTTDLAVIAVDAENLTPAKFGDSDALQLGDRVLALGNNSGLGWTVTGGMVSGLARDVYEETNYAIKCLQVDAVINPGNSGGPLLNSSGQVVGINSAKIVAEGYEGLGFSIPINEAKTVLEDLVAHGYVKGRVMLGIQGNTFDTYRGYEGFLISAISENSCFIGTEAKVGDIITHVNNVRVKSYAEMREQLTSYEVGETISITLLRIQRNSPTADTVTVEITLMESDGTV